MNIQITQLQRDPKPTGGAVVVIDVFRAFSVESYLFAGGVEKIIPLADLDEAYRLKQENPHYMLVGERGGAMCEGFDFGNSPAQFKDADLGGKTVLHTTSAGTQGLYAAQGAELVLAAGLVNAAATAKYLLQSGHTDITLMCTGLSGRNPAEEDVLGARYIKSLLLGEDFPLAAEIEALKQTSGAKFFDPDNRIFPEEDFHLCTKADIFPFALQMEIGADGRKYMKKQTVL